MPLTGAQADAGTGILHAEELAADQINAAGGVLGRKIVLDEQDDACDPRSAVRAATKLVSKGVQAFVGNYCSSAALAAAPIVAKANLPNIQPDANDPALVAAKYANLFLMDPTATGNASTAAAFFSHVIGAKTVVVADDQSAFAITVANLTASDLKAAGVAVPAIQAIPASSTDFSNIIDAVKSTGADGVYWTGYYAQAALFVKQLRAAGLERPTFAAADGAVDPTFLKDAGAAANGTYATIVTTTQFLVGSRAKAFTAQYESRFHSAPGPFSAYGYDAIHTLAAAINAARSTSAAKVIRALHAIHYDGITGPISFTNDGGRLGAKFVVLEVRNGAYTLAPNQP